jgi:hypothetical protein
MDMQQQPAPIKINPVILIVAVIVVLGGGVGLGYVFLNKGGQKAPEVAQIAQQTAPATGEQPTMPPPTATPAPEDALPPPPPSVGFYGTVVKRDGTSVTIQQILPPTTPGGKLTEGKLYTVTAEETISYINQQKNPAPKAGEPPFSPKPGSLSGLVKGLYVYIETNDDIASKTAIKANQVMYSVESPF